MKPLPAQVTMLSPPPSLSLYADEEEMAAIIQRSLPDYLEWLPQTIKFKITLTERSDFIYSPVFFFRKHGSDHALVISVLKPKSLPLPNVFKVKVLEDTCRSVDIHALLVLNECDGEDLRVRQLLNEWEINYVVMKKPSDIVAIVIRHFGPNPVVQQCA